MQEPHTHNQTAAYPYFYFAWTSAGLRLWMRMSA